MKLPIVCELIRLRLAAGMTQKQAARKSGVGFGTISSFESGARIRAMRLEHLARLLDAYGDTPAAFFARLEAAFQADKLAREIASERRASSPRSSPLSWNA